MATPKLKYLPHYTVADYRQWEGDWELWNGVPVAMTPSPFGPHQQAARKLIVQLTLALEAARCGCEVLHELDWIIADDTIVRPDVVVVCDGVPEQHLHSAPALVAEVLSASTASKDRTSKRELYARCGVPYYLIVDPDSQAIELLRLATDHYESASLDQPINLTDTCQITLRLEGTGVGYRVSGHLALRERSTPQRRERVPHTSSKRKRVNQDRVTRARS